MKHILFPLIGLFLILACNMPLFPPSPTPPVFPPIATPIPPLFLQTATSPPPVLPSSTPPLPSETPTSLPPTATITPTFTPSVPLVTPKDQPVNCRYGPGPEWLAISALKLGVSAEIVGRNASSTWWYIKDPLHANAFCWVWSGATTVSGNVDGLPVIPSPKAKVVAVDISISRGISVCPVMEVTFNGSISTNGPVTVTYRWEIRGDTIMNPMPNDTTLILEAKELAFTEAGTQTFSSETTTLGCGSFSVTLHVLAPNDMKSEVSFTLP